MFDFNFNSIIELINIFDTEQKCINFLELQRWNGNVVSPYDSSSVVWKYKKDNCYKCKNTGKMFNVRTDTLFEKSHVPLQKWFVAIYIITSHKKGISSNQLAKDLKVTQKTSWYMLQRIRKCFAIKHSQLRNIVESDESFWGGWRKRGQGGKCKAVIHGMVERGGKLIAKVVPNRKKATLLPEILENVMANASIMTDELKSYKSLHKYYDHQSVNHSAKEYVRGAIHTNTIKGAWSLLKRGLFGIYHFTAREHLQKYLDEFVFRYNTKDFTEQERFGYFFRNMKHRIKYKDLIQHCWSGDKRSII